MPTTGAAKAAKCALRERPREQRIFSSSALHAARFFHYASSSARLLDVADALRDLPALPAVAVVDGEGKAIGIVRREALFALTGKPFGREVLGRSLVAEIVEEVAAFDAHADLFAVAQKLLPGSGDSSREAEARFCLLTGEDGSFLALLDSQDIANYLSRMTQDDIELAGRLQERLLAGEGQASEGRKAGEPWGIEAWSRPAKGVGGDFYFTKRLDDGRLFLTLCDVSGKGVAASLIVAMVWGMLRMFDYGRGLRELVQGLNEAVVATFHMEKYLTGIFLFYDPATRRLSSADMGHSHAVLFRGGKALSLREPKGNLPIGVDQELDPVILPYRLESGDRLFLYSDGLTEQENSRSEEYGEKRLKAAAAEAISRGSSLREALPAAIDAHRGGTPQQDDMSFLMLSLP
jgi:phosphoserine phosphatase RsbU/P